MALAEGRVATVDADAVFRTFATCPSDLKTLIVDVRDRKKWVAGHIAGSYCIRKPSSGDTLLDYSKAEYDQKWSVDVWWNRHVIVYGEAGLKKDHPVLAFLATDKHACSIGIYRDGLEAFQQRYPFLVTTSLRSGAAVRHYPSQLDPLLYLGDWSHAEALERHAELGIQAVVTIHNNPDNLKLPPAKYSHLKIELADIVVADIGAHLLPTFDFIEEAVARKRAVLVHCGAGVSRSATLCIAYLMRKNRWSAQKALEFTKARRSLVAPNDGFWRTLCALEARLGIAERSNVDAFSGFHGADAAPLAAIKEPKTRVTFIPAGGILAPVGSKVKTAVPLPAPPPTAAARNGRDGERECERWQERCRSRDRERCSRSRSRDCRGRRRRRSRSRSKSGDRRRRRSRSRSKSGDRRRRRSRSRSKSGDRRRRRSRSRSKSGDRRRRRSRSRSKSGDRRRRRSRSRSKSRDRRRQDVKQQSGADAPVVAAPKQQQQERVDLESTEGGVLEVVREGNSLGHLVIKLQRLSKGCVFGRLPSCDVPLEHLSISRVHAQLTTDAAGGLFVTDMGSAHGTNVDGTWIKAKVPKQLRVGNVFKLGASARQYKVVKLPQRTARQ